ncbi:MAG: hypothetical protein K9G38_08090 [Bacteroidales bacterium]|nr:hypothetical protein [Bacteroidales bacterium]
MTGKSYAVIAGEIAESRKTARDHLGRIPDIIRKSFTEVNQHVDPGARFDFEIIRMDEFLCLSANPGHALKAALMLASCFRNLSYKELNERYELRLSIGIGPAELYKEQLRESDGTVFRYADEGLRSMRRNQRLLITTPDASLNDEFMVVCGFMDILIHDWSDEQAEALFLSMAGENQVQISKLLNISQPAVNRRLKAAHQEAIEKFLARYHTQLT